MTSYSVGRYHINIFSNLMSFITGLMSESDVRVMCYWAQKYGKEQKACFRPSNFEIFGFQAGQHSESELQAFGLEMSGTPV